jgi:hypothetical protein
LKKLAETKEEKAKRLCRHEGTCSQNVIRGFLRSYVIIYGEHFF